MSCGAVTDGAVFGFAMSGCVVSVTHHALSGDLPTVAASSDLSQVAVFKCYIALRRCLGVSVAEEDSFVWR